MQKIFSHAITMPNKDDLVYIILPLIPLFLVFLVFLMVIFHNH